MTKISRLAVRAFIVPALVVGGCGDASGPAAPGAGDRATTPPDRPMGCHEPGASPPGVPGSTPCPDLSAPDGPERVEPRDDLVDVRPQSWERVEVRAEGRALDVVFWGGVQDCYGVDRVAVEERARRVIVTLYTGRVPSAEVCIELAVKQVVRVLLDRPLGERAVVDGAE